jgi:hypothetical protein
LKTIIAGSRDITDINIVVKAVADSGFQITEVVSGTARGVDRLGEEWATLQKVPIKRFPADWNKHGKSAGYLRNKEMAEYADQAIVVILNGSKGSTHMANLAKSNNLPTFVVNLTL